MTVILAIAVVVAIAFMGLLTTRVTVIEKQRSDTSAFDELKRYTTESVKTSNGNFASIATRFAKEDERIEDIINQLEAITADIKRLDETTAQDHRDLVDIRERYILWRKPINWAGDYEEQESEERS